MSIPIRRIWEVLPAIFARKWFLPAVRPQMGHQLALGLALLPAFSTSIDKLSSVLDLFLFLMVIYRFFSSICPIAFRILRLRLHHGLPLLATAVTVHIGAWHRTCLPLWTVRDSECVSVDGGAEECTQKTVTPTKLLDGGLNWAESCMIVIDETNKNVWCSRTSA